MTLELSRFCGLQWPFDRLRVTECYSIRCAARAVSSVGERFLDTEEVSGSIPLPPTIKIVIFSSGTLRFFCTTGILKDGEWMKNSMLRVSAGVFAVMLVGLLLWGAAPKTVSAAGLQVVAQETPTEAPTQTPSAATTPSGTMNNPSPSVPTYNGKPAGTDMLNDNPNGPNWLSKFARNPGLDTSGGSSMRRAKTPPSCGSPTDLATVERLALQLPQTRGLPSTSIMDAVARGNYARVDVETKGVYAAYFQYRNGAWRPAAQSDIETGLPNAHLCHNPHFVNRPSGP